MAAPPPFPPPGSSLTSASSPPSEVGRGPLRGPSFERWRESRQETPPSQEDSSTLTESMGSVTPDSLNERSARALRPHVEDIGSDTEEDSFHSTGSKLQEVSEIDSLDMCQQFHELSTIDKGESLADPGVPRGASTPSDAVGPRRSTRTTRGRLPERYHDFRM